jgi:hypothetical protein
MHPRLEEEWDDIVAEYPSARHDASPERVVVGVEVDDHIYNRRSTSVAVLVPPGYRATGPDGFLVPSGFSFVHGEPFPAGDAAGLGLSGWLVVSFHMIDANGQSTWRPTADPHRGDNILGYLQSIESFLARRCN